MRSKGLSRLQNLQLTSSELKHTLHFIVNKGSYMSAPVLLNLLNELRKKGKMRGLLSILSHCRNKLNNTEAQNIRSYDTKVTPRSHLFIE